MFLGLKGHRRLRLNICDNKLFATDHVKLLGIEVDNKLKFSKHVKTLCSKVNKKISAFSRLSMYISRKQALTICNAVILSNFNRPFSYSTKEPGSSGIFIQFYRRGSIEWR